MALESARRLAHELARTDAERAPRHCASTKFGSARGSKRPRTIRGCWLGWSCDAVESLRRCVIWFWPRSAQKSRWARFRSSSPSQRWTRGLDGYAPHVEVGTEVDRRRTISRLALLTAVVDWLGVLSLIIFFAVGGGPFGFINDVANGLVGLLSLALAWLWVPDVRSRWSTLAIGAATLGALVMVAGSILIIFDITGWYLAGLVSSVGSGFIGVWLLVSNRLHRHAAELPRGMIMLGVTSAIFLIIGFFALPGVLAGIDDPQLAPWYVNAGLLSWMGTYWLYPAWCLWLSRRYGG
jgi:hypothetical protein